MKKVYFLKSCSTNQRILKQLNLGEEVELQNIKEKNIDEETLAFLKEKVGSYEALFSKKAMKYRPSKYRTRVAPIPGDQIETVGDEMKSPIQGIFQIS